MKIVKSDNIHTIHYEPKTKILEVKFHGSDHVYHYENVLEHQYKAFENAKSHGEHFAKHIKGRFVHKKHHGKKDKKV